MSVLTQDGIGAFVTRALASRSFVTGFIITAMIALMALISFFWTPYDVTKLIVSDRMLPPSSTHLFGTDHFGRDVLSMIMVGSRNSIAVAHGSGRHRHGHRGAARLPGGGAWRRA